VAPVSERDDTRVVAAVLHDADGRVLITQRPAGKWMAGCWEFPGGKLESSETGRQALIRELAEELGVRVLACEPLLTLSHDYPERRVQLAVWKVLAYEGEPTGLEGQRLRWLPPRALYAEPMLPADWPIVDTLVKLQSQRG
jgi:8-oxo-dGTP diphosphatase